MEIIKIPQDCTFNLVMQMASSQEMNLTTATSYPKSSQGVPKPGDLLAIKNQMNSQYINGISTDKWNPSQSKHFSRMPATKDDLNT